MAITKDFIVTDGLTVGSGVLAASANVTGNARVGGDLTVVGNITGSLTVSNTAIFSNSVTINGNLTVSGTTMYVNTATLNVSDNIITLNADWLANTAPSENAGLEINRGSAANVAFRWNETGDVWEITQDGTNYGRVHSKLTDIALGTDTSGNYVATIASGVGLTGSGSGEGSTPTLAVVAGAGIASNATGVHVVAGSGVASNATGVHVVAGSGIASNATGVHVVAGTGVTSNATGVHIGQAVETTSTPTFGPRVTLNFANTSTGGIPTLSTQTANGTFAAPTQTTTGALIFRISPTAYTGSAYTGTASIEAVATENIESLKRGSRWDFKSIIAGTPDFSVMSWDGSNLTLNTVNVATQTFSSNATNLSSGTIPYARIPANVANTTADFSIAGAWTFNANVTFGAADHIVLSSTSGISANGSYGTTSHVLHTNGSAVYWAADDNTTYDLAAIANTTASNAILRLADSSNANDNVFFVGTDEVVTSSNATHIIIDHADVARANNTTVASPASGGTFTAVDSITTNARGHVTAINTKTVTLPIDPDTNTTYDLLAVANTAVNAGLLRLSASNLANDTVTFTGTGAASVQSNATHISINANDTNETYVIKNIANTVANEARIQLLPTDSPSSNTTAKFVGGGTTTVSANTTALLISSADQYVGTVTSVASGNGLTGGTITTTGTLSVVAGTGVTSNATGVHIGQAVGTASNVKFANVLITTAALGGTATNLVNTFTIQTSVGNESYLRFHTYRHTTGADWTSASSRIQQRIDVTDQAYIEFNPASYQSGIGIFSQAGKGFVVDTNGTTNYSANVAMSNNHIINPTLQAYKEQVNATTISTSTQTLDLSLTNIYNLTLASSTTITFSNPPASGTAYTVTLYCKQDATGSRTITWPAAVKWPNASVPTLSTGANKIDIFSFITVDGGTTYVGALALANVG